MATTETRFPNRLPLAFLIVSSFGAFTCNIASALTVLVTECDDGPTSGTLRNTIAKAPDSSIVQISLMCSKITLTQGEIEIPNTITNMYIVGNGPSATVIDGGSTSTPPSHQPVFEAENSGTLGFSQMTITHGDQSVFFPQGGCIDDEFGSVGLNHAVVTGCSVSSPKLAVDSKGGAIYAAGSVTLFESTVSNSTATGGPGFTAFGGGIYAQQGVNLTSSTLSGNAAVAGVHGLASKGGGFYAKSDGGSQISKSTISGNHADIDAALCVNNFSNKFKLNIVSSTIANNVSTFFVSVGSAVPTYVTNSTIAYNRVGFGSHGSPAGLYSSASLALNNSILASNTAKNGTSYDVFTSGFTSGSTNLITAADLAEPMDTIASCPLLGHLSINGGVTQTLPLRARSPALDVGAANAQLTDQRGTEFPRTVGSGTDIGAYERQAGVVDDVIFYAQFEGPCD